MFDTMGIFLSFSVQYFIVIRKLPNMASAKHLASLIRIYSHVHIDNYSSSKEKQKKKKLRKQKYRWYIISRRNNFHPDWCCMIMMCSGSLMILYASVHIYKTSIHCWIYRQLRHHIRIIITMAKTPITTSEPLHKCSSFVSLLLFIFFFFYSFAYSFACENLI